MRLSPEQQAEVEALRQESTPTRRATVPALEELLYTPLPVLDHGFVRVIDYMGDDAAIVQAARVSYGKGTKRRSDDAGLINYLMRNAHTSPFEMCELKLHVKLPIFVARQWVRHRMANLNEYSARYSVLDREFYTPAPEQLAVQSATNRQGRGDVLPPEQAQQVLAVLKGDAEAAFSHYEQMLGDAEGEAGLARELARIGLPLSTYTQWYWKCDLHNLLGFLRLRADAHAQWEIREYARVLLEVVERWVPLTYAAFTAYLMGGAHLSAKALEAVRALVAGKPVDPAALGLSAREWRELRATLELPAE
ncbi:MAG: FAD-dependent thymidylate synthase [Chloroflexota bacterium]